MIVYDKSEFCIITIERIKNLDKQSLFLKLINGFKVNKYIRYNRI